MPEPGSENPFQLALKSVWFCWVSTSAPVPSLTVPARGERRSTSHAVGRGDHQRLTAGVHREDADEDLCAMRKAKPASGRAGVLTGGGHRHEVGEPRSRARRPLVLAARRSDLDRRATASRVAVERRRSGGGRLGRVRRTVPEVAADRPVRRHLGAGRLEVDVRVGTVADDEVPGPGLEVSRSRALRRIRGNVRGLATGVTAGVRRVNVSAANPASRVTWVVIDEEPVRGTRVWRRTGVARADDHGATSREEGRAAYRRPGPAHRVEFDRRALPRH